MVKQESVMSYIITSMEEKDWPRVAAIYQEGIDMGNATFQGEVPSWEAWDSSHLPACRFVAREGNTVLGWVALSPTSSREVFRGVVEVSIYIASSARSKGVGKALLTHLVGESEACGLWSLQSAIFPENTPSLSLHKKCGFREIGFRERAGRMPDGRWRDIVLLERRSTVVGLQGR